MVIVPPSQQTPSFPRPASPRPASPAGLDRPGAIVAYGGVVDSRGVGFPLQVEEPVSRSAACRGPAFRDLSQADPLGHGPTKLPPEEDRGGEACHAWRPVETGVEPERPVRSLRDSL